MQCQVDASVWEIMSVHVSFKNLHTDIPSGGVNDGISYDVEDLFATRQYSLVREAEFTLPIFNRAVIIRDSEGLHDPTPRPGLLTAKDLEKDKVRICEHDLKAIAFLGIEQRGPCCILVANEP